MSAVFLGGGLLVVAGDALGQIAGEGIGIATLDNVPGRVMIDLLRRSDNAWLRRQFSADDGTYRFTALAVGIEYDVIGRDVTNTWDDVIVGRVQPYAAPQITTSSLAFTVGNPATTQMAAQYGGEPFTWSADVLPPGLALSAAGLWSGMATVSGVYAVTVTVVDTFGETGARTYTVTVT